MNKKASVKQDIGRAAMECFLKYGLEKTTLEDIAKAVGMNKSSLFYYYKNKELYSLKLQYYRGGIEPGVCTWAGSSLSAEACTQTVNTYGYAASVSVDLSHNFLAKANYYSDYLKNNNNSQINNFNTPHFHVNLEFGNTGFGKKQNWSFNTTLRYKPGYHYEVSGGLGNGTVPASTLIDAQIGYAFPEIHSSIKIGGTNIANKYYSTGIANPLIGAVYYVSLAYNVF